MGEVRAPIGGIAWGAPVPCRAPLKRPAIAQDLLARIHPAAGEPDRELLQRSLERYRPTNLSELHMALRAAADGEPSDLVEAVRRLADEQPERTLGEILAQRPGAAP